MTYPTMPTIKPSMRHRQKEKTGAARLFALIAQSIPRKEFSTMRGGNEAMKAEWNNLRKKETWNDTTVAEWSDVASNARKANRKSRMARLVGIGVVKNWEIPDLRKPKDRVVFQGNNVTTESWQ